MQRVLGFVTVQQFGQRLSCTESKNPRGDCSHKQDVVQLGSLSIGAGSTPGFVAVQQFGQHLSGMQCKTRGVIAQSKTHRCNCTDKQG